MPKISPSWPDLSTGLALALMGLILQFYLIDAFSNGEGVEFKRGRAFIGDAYFPRLIAIALILFGLCLAASSLRRRQDALRPSGLFAPASFLALGLLGLALGAAWVVTYLIVPTIVEVLISTDPRALYLQTPWRQLPFVLGAFFVPLILISAAERKVRIRTLIISLLFPAILGAIYTVPFDDLFLPPVGDL